MWIYISPGAGFPLTPGQIRHENALQSGRRGKKKSMNAFVFHLVSVEGGGGKRDGPIEGQGRMINRECDGKMVTLSSSGPI
ncbi:hypothetical protein GWI33_006343 [Rhynchophorus ferrugineus]|uniref:Uncharacterized protein n=1 Tax=Rhynchophorus ferrugineus TaxID=354439 RepID=A0A834IUR7_RHYFE|nr:hypothetical protein GWI33_006343 [Rhynchophorus ferrugineus]